jgi:hypothetical protein
MAVLPPQIALDFDGAIDLADRLTEVAYALKEREEAEAGEDIES